MRRRIALAATSLTLALLLPLGAAPALAATDDGDGPPAVAWSVSTVDGEHGTARPNFAYAVDPGDVISDTMQVTNTGSTPLDLTVYAADAFTTPTGQVDLLAGQEVAIDAGAWVTPATEQVLLQPGEQTDIAFTITVPDDASPGDHSAGLLTSYRSGGEGETLSVDRRLGTRITLRVSGELQPAVSLEGVETSYSAGWNPFAPGELVISYEATNTGNTLLAGTDASSTTALFGLVDSSPEPLALPEVIPGSTIEVTRVISVAPWGWLTGSITLYPEAVGYGAQALEPVAVEYSVAAVPWPLLGVIVVIALVAALAWWLAARRRRTP